VAVCKIENAQVIFHMSPRSRVEIDTRGQQLIGVGGGAALIAGFLWEQIKRIHLNFSPLPISRRVPCFYLIVAHPSQVLFSK
jgi:hypothetical protein